MNHVGSISQLPPDSALYALYGGRGSHQYVAYVGTTDNLRRRINHHLAQRNSSITTGVAAVSLNPDLVTEVAWWQHRLFSDSLKLQAAEVLAFEILKPVLRSRANVPRLVEDQAGEPAFASEMQLLLGGPSTGRFLRTSLPDALERLTAVEGRARALEDRVETLEALLRSRGDGSPPNT